MAFPVVFFIKWDLTPPSSFLAFQDEMFSFAHLSPSTNSVTLLVTSTPISFVFHYSFVKGQPPHLTWPWLSRHAICQETSKKSPDSGPLKSLPGMFPRKHSASYPCPIHLPCSRIFIPIKVSDLFWTKCCNIAQREWWFHIILKVWF